MTKHDLALSRRALISAMLSAGGGLAVGVFVPSFAQAKQLGAVLSGDESLAPREMNAFIVIDPDNTVTVRLPHTEMGQGAATALSMIVAEELECDWTKVQCEHASANRNLRDKGVYRSMTTVGSQGVRTSYAYLQQAGASARVRLVQTAAEQWQVPVVECAAANGAVTHLPSKRSLTFGALATKAAAITLGTEPTTKTPDQFRFIGKHTARLDSAPKVNGSAQFGIDTQLPGMVYAAVANCPVFGGLLKAVDDSPAKGQRGVIAVVKLENAVVVVADRYWRARSALALLKPEWDVGDRAAVDTPMLKKMYLNALDGPMVTAEKIGDPDGALAAPGAKLVSATYEAPMLSHAPMEPMNATVQISAERVDVWIGSQSPPAALRQAAQAAGVDPSKVFVHNCYVGGGFGRRTQHEELIQAVQVAKVVGKPVKLIWSREEDIRQDHYRPQAAARFNAVIGPDGKTTALDIKIAVPSIFRSLKINPAANGLEPMAFETMGSAASPYNIPNKQIGLMLKNTYVPVMFWRGVGGSQNCFLMESFVDEMAHAAGVDPWEFRRSMVTRPDMIGVLNVMKEKGNWGKPMGPGQGRGMAICESYNSVTGQVAEVTVTPDGKLKVDRVVCVVDCYHVVNPNTVEQQCQGGAIMALTAALYGEINIDKGATVQSNFNTYRLLSMAETPQIEVYLPASGGPKWGGIGEPSVPPLAPAVCNAIFAATGIRVRSLPLKNVNLKKA